MRKAINRGSEWRKWDLHLHTFNTNMNNQFGCDVNTYLQKIEKSDISVFGITDYFTVDNQFKIIKEFKNKYPNSNKVFFVNVEFRLNENVSKEPAGHVNAHLIFDNNIKESQVKDLISSLRLTQTNPNGTFKKISELKSERDYQSATINLKNIQDNLKSQFGSDKPYLIALAAGGHGGIRPSIQDDGDDYRSKGARRNGPLSDELDKLADFLFGDVQSTDYYLNRQKKGDTYQKSPRYNCAIDKPVIKASDAHRLEKCGETNGIGDEYSWIKSDITFEGLRQIIFEPESRVSLSLEKPEAKSSYLVIDHVEFKQKSNFPTGPETTSVYFNSNLNTIIGGRSNGKSTLTNSIAKSLGNEVFTSNEDTSTHNMHTFNDADFKVYWQGDSEPNNDRQVEFIPQDYMITLAEDDLARNKLIRSTVETDECNYEKIINYEKNIQENNSEIRQLIEELETLNQQLTNLKSPEGDKAGIKKQLESINESIKEQSDKVAFSAESQKKYQLADDNLKKLTDKKRLTELNLQDLASIKNQKIKLQSPLSGTNDSDYNKQLTDFLCTLEQEANQKWQEKLLSIETEQNNHLDSFQEAVNKVLVSPDYVNGQKSLKNNQELKNLSKNLKFESEKLVEFKRFESEKENINSRKIEKQKQILNTYENFKKYQDDLKQTFKAKPAGGKIEIAIDFSNIPFEDNIHYLRGRNAENDRFISEFNERRDTLIKNIFQERHLSFNTGGDADTLVKDILSKKWTNLNYILKYDNDDFSQMSQGKKAFVILTLILEFSQDKKPVIIDQPEDSLDNRSIYQDLTRYLKSKKKERQIILVTHNPNVVVGSDAENVIVANQNSSKTPNKNNVQFSYINGPLENTFLNPNSERLLESKGIREHVIEILEGGKEAFKERENKYTSEFSSSI